jgi:hypothetical protein
VEQTCGPPRKLSKHGLKRFHALPCQLRQASIEGAVRWDEPVEIWRRFRRSAAATLSILSDLTDGTGFGRP